MRILDSCEFSLIVNEDLKLFSALRDDGKFLGFTDAAQLLDECFGANDDRTVAQAFVTKSEMIASIFCSFGS